MGPCSRYHVRILSLMLVIDLLVFRTLFLEPTGYGGCFCSSLYSVFYTCLSPVFACTPPQRKISLSCSCLTHSASGLLANLPRPFQTS